MDREARNQKYEDYIKAVSREAAAAGRREPYYLTYRKKCGMKESGRRKENAGEIAETQKEQC